jgi:hypothetical protein
LATAMQHNGHAQYAAIELTPQAALIGHDMPRSRASGADAVERIASMRRMTAKDLPVARTLLSYLGKVWRHTNFTTGTRPSPNRLITR